MSEYGNSDYFEYNGERVDFHYKTEITPTEMMQFVDNVIVAVVGNNYYPFLLDLVFNYEIIRRFTDIDVDSYVAYPDAFDDCAEFFKKSDLSTNIKIDIPSNVYDALYIAVATAIEYKTGVHSSPIELSVSNLINTIDDKIGSIDFVNMSELSGMINGLRGELNMDKLLDAYGQRKFYKNGIDSGVGINERQ